MLLCQASSGRASGLDGLEFLPAFDSSADLIDDFAEGRAHRDFYQADIVDFAGKGEYLGSFGLFSTDGREPVCPAGEDYGNVGECLDIVYIGRLPEISRFGRERRFHGRFSPLSFHRMDKGRLFSAYESSCTITDFNIETESRPEDVLPQKAIFPGLCDSGLQPVYSQRIFGSDVHQAF